MNGADIQIDIFFFIYKVTQRLTCTVQHAVLNAVVTVNAEMFLSLGNKV